MVRQLSPLILSDKERAELKALAGRRKTAQALALRARIVLACAEGSQNKEVAAKLLAPLRHANCSEQSLRSEVKRKTFARFECFAF